MGNRTAELDALLSGVSADETHLNPFDLAVIKGARALNPISTALEVELGVDLDQTPPDWLKKWAAKLTPAEIAEIKKGRDREFAALRMDIEALLGEDEREWTDAERDHTAAARERLRAANLVLSCLDEAIIRVA